MTGIDRSIFEPGALALAALLDVSNAAIFQPPPTMTVPDWADEYRYLSADVGAVGGRWETHRVEVARGPMMAVTEPGVRNISVMACTQTMKTELLTNTIGYFAHLDPSPILLTEPKDEMAQAFSKERLSKMVGATPVLKGLMGDARTRKTEDTLAYKTFPGGFIAMLGAGSPSNLAMRAIRITLLDEIDKYETTKEGDPVALAEERTSTFTHSSLRLRACSPTTEETSRIYASFIEGDQRLPYCSCPHCGHWQHLDFFEHVHWEKNEETGEHFAETAAIYCDGCGVEWTERQREAIATTKHAIRYMQTRPFIHCDTRQNPRDNHKAWKAAVDAGAEEIPREAWEWDDEHQVGYAVCSCCGERAVGNEHASFQAGKLLSPFISVVELVKKWLTARNNPELKQTFYNTQLGLPWKMDVEKEVGAHILSEKMETYHAEVPSGVVVLTAGVDVQSEGTGGNGRLEARVYGWAPGFESWLVHREVITGDPAKPEVWNKLDSLLLKGFRHEEGFNLYIRGACVDSGGHNAQAVYDFCRPRIQRNVWAIKGASDRSGQWSPLWPAQDREKKHKKFRVGYRPVLLGVNAGKEAVRQQLLVADEGPGYSHFPVGTPNEEFEQLTSEKLVVEKSIRQWKKKHEHIRNEGLDCRVYALAAVYGLIHTRKFSLERAALQIENHVEQLRVAAPSTSTEKIAESAIRFRDALMALAEGKPVPVQQPAPPAPERRTPRISRSSFMNG